MKFEMRSGLGERENRPPMPNPTEIRRATNQEENIVTENIGHRVKAGSERVLEIISNGRNSGIIIEHAKSLGIGGA
jgi:hypothetical protein